MITLSDELMNEVAALSDDERIGNAVLDFTKAVAKEVEAIRANLEGANVTDMTGVTDAFDLIVKLQKEL